MDKDILICILIVAFKNKMNIFTLASKILSCCFQRNDSTRRHDTSRDVREMDPKLLIPRHTE